MRKVVVVLVVLLGLLVGADFAAAAFAEHTVSQKAREQLSLQQDPSVTIHGFPFVTQALSGEYDHISLSAQGVRVQDLRDVSVKAELTDVRAPLSDLTSGKTRSVTIGHIEGQVTLKASDIARVPPLTKIEDLRIEPASESYVRNGAGNDPSDGDGDGGNDDSGMDGDQDQAGGQDGNAGKDDQDADAKEHDDSTAGVRLSGKVDIAGERMNIFAFAIIELDGTTIRITPHRLQFGNDQDTTVVPPAVQRQLLPAFEADINAGDLPFAVTPTAISVSSGSITMKGEASDVAFAKASARGGGS
jgi:hypothetical protein